MKETFITSLFIYFSISHKRKKEIAQTFLVSQYTKFWRDASNCETDCNIRNIYSQKTISANVFSDCEGLLSGCPESFRLKENTFLA